jgi:PAS domain S-box-containing protein
VSELAETRMELDEARRFNHALFELSPDAFLACDPSGIIRAANAVAGELLGFGAEWLVGRPLTMFVPADSRRALRSEILRLGREPGRCQFEFRFRPRGAPPFAALVTAAGIPGPGGRPERVLWSIRDETVVKLAESSLRTAEQEIERQVLERTERLGRDVLALERRLVLAQANYLANVDDERRAGALIDGLGAIVWRADAQTGCTTFISRYAEDLLGYPVASWLDDPDFWARVVHADDRDFAMRRRRALLATGNATDAEFRAVSATGRVRWFRETVQFARDHAGRLLELRGLMVDVTRRKKIERQIYSARRELAVRLDDAVFLNRLVVKLVAPASLATKCRETLAGLAAIFGAERGIMFLRYPGRDRLQVAAALGLGDVDTAAVAGATGEIGPPWTALAGREVACADVTTADDPALRQAGKAAGFRGVWGQPLVTQAGQSLGSAAVFFDQPHAPPNDQARLASSFAQQAAEVLQASLSYEEAREADERKEQFMALLAHELRNPLSTLRMAGELLRAAAEDPAVIQEAAAIIEREVGQLHRMVNDLQDSARIAHGKLHVEPVRVDVAQAIEAAVAAARPQAVERGQVVTVLLPATPLWLMADPGRLEQILVNLLHNAIKFTGPDGRIEIIAESAESETAVVIRVRDTGIGMDPGQTAEIFDLYKQVSPGPGTANGAGLGIGLALVRDLVDLHGGRVEAHSAGPGMGSEFVVTFPAPNEI